jgi:hypothetical protein
MRGRSAAELLSLPVRSRGIQLGRPVDALVDPATGRLLGFEVRCGDDAQRFLPFAVVELRAGEIAVGSALALIDERDLGYYRSRARSIDKLGFADPWVDALGVVHEALSVA